MSALCGWHLIRSKGPQSGPNFHLKNNSVFLLEGKLSDFMSNFYKIGANGAICPKIVLIEDFKSWLRHEEGVMCVLSAVVRVLDAVCV